jgi:hypothetical protein
LALLAAENLVVEMLEEVGIGFVGDAAIGFMRRAHCLRWEGLPGRAAWWRIVPEPTVLENLPYDVALMGLTTSNGRTCKRKQFGYGNSSSSECILAKHSLPYG